MNLRHILFIELLGGIGDLLIALSAIQAIGRSHAAHLTVLTFAPGAELLTHDPLIDRVVIAPSGQARQAIEALLSHQTFDLIVSDTNYEGIADLIQSGAARVVTNLWRSPPNDQRVGDRFLQILRDEELITPQSMVSDRASPYAHSLRHSRNGGALLYAPPQLHFTASELAAAQASLGAAFRPLVFLFPDAGMPIKRWHPDRFVQVGKALQQQYGATVIVPIGADPQVSIQIAQDIGGTAQTWQRGTIRQLAAVLAQGDLFIGADTGSARIAAALDVPTITLFGPSWHDRYGQPAPHINLQGYPQCPDRQPQNFTQQPCWYGKCPFDQWDTCLEAIDPRDVITAATRLLQKQDKSETRPTSSIPPQSGSKLHPSSLWASAQNLLVMRLDNIGDVIMTSPALRAIKANLPQARLTLMASPGGSLVAPLLPWVDEVLPWRTLWQDLGKLSFDPDREWQLINTLKSHRFDAAIILTSFSQSPHPAAIVCALAEIPLRLGESKEADGNLLTTAVPPAPDDIHQVDRNLRLLEAIGFHIPDRALSLQIPTSSSPPLPPYLLLNPYTSCQSRNYDEERLAIAACQLAETTGFAVVVTGVEKDRDRSEPLFRILGDRGMVSDRASPYAGAGALLYDRIGQTTLAELAVLVANAQLVLTNNTSTMHIADATRTPTVVLFAGTELECQWRPRSAPSRLLRRSTVCSPCYAFTCPYQLQCLDIPAADVVNAGLELLSMANLSVN